MDPKLIARLLAGGRIAIGLGAYLAPGPAARGWLGDAADDPGTKLATRAFGARDVALGVGSLASLDNGDPRRWLEAGIIADVGDAIATLLARDARPARTVTGIVAVAGGAAAVGAWLRGALAEG